jgi:hypothetical protein
MEQGTEEWRLARLGKVTASRVSDARAKKGTATRANYIADIIAERLTGTVAETFTNSFMVSDTNRKVGGAGCYCGSSDDP